MLPRIGSSAQSADRADGDEQPHDRSTEGGTAGILRRLLMASGMCHCGLLGVAVILCS